MRMKDTQHADQRGKVMSGLQNKCPVCHRPKLICNPLCSVCMDEVKPQKPLRDYEVK
jgi:uncharacterized protein (DUF983 family)